MSVLVGTLWIPAASDPELLPVFQAVAVDGAAPGDGESVGMVGVDECREILACLAFYTCLADGVVYDTVAAAKGCSLAEVQVGAGFEEQCPGEECATGDDDDATALACCPVDDMLYRCRLYGGAVTGLHIVVGDDILPS